MHLHILTVVALGIATNLDNLIIGMSFGLSGRRLDWRKNGLIALVSGFFAWTACAAAGFISDSHTAAAVFAGSVLLIGMGAATIFKSLRRPVQTEQKSEYEQGVSLKQTLLLAVTLGLNCLPVAFGAGLSEVPWLHLAVSVMLFSFVFVGVGNRMGAKLRRFCPEKALDILSGTILIVIGVLEFFV